MKRQASVKKESSRKPT
jgi:hypothetical protein